MGKRKARPVPCWACGFTHDFNLDGWVILLSNELICDPVTKPECWEKVSEHYAKKRGLTDANKEVR